MRAWLVLPDVMRDPSETKDKDLRLGSFSGSIAAGQ
jgi:hypothetical protein